MDPTTLEVSYPEVQQQTYGSDCGPLAIAFAFDAALGLDVSGQRYNARELRNHLIRNIEMLSNTIKFIFKYHSFINQADLDHPR